MRNQLNMKTWESVDQVYTVREKASVDSLIEYDRLVLFQLSRKALERKLEMCKTLPEAQRTPGIESIT